MMKKFLIYNLKLSIFPLFIVMFLMVGGIVMAVEDLPTPTIAVSPDVYYPLEEIIYLEGRGKSNATIQIQFQKQGLKPITLNTKSDAGGEWVLTEKVPLEAGDWEVRARLIQSSGESSEWSNPRVLKTIVTGIVIGGITIKFAFLLFLLITVIAISIILVLYSSFKTKTYKENIQSLRIKEFEERLAEKNTALEKALLEKGKAEAEGTLEKSFEDLRRLILQELEHLQELTDGRALTKEEEKHKEHLLTELKAAEEKIAEKIQHIE